LLSLPTTNTTAANAEDESSPPVRDDAIKERASTVSDVCDGTCDECPFFHTMAGAALATPKVMAMAVVMTESFMVKE
jgi:hypothetical protein